jgi:para-aminobenzoate synthetase component 1
MPEDEPSTERLPPSPATLAARMRKEDGFVWLDSPDGTGISLLASRPDMILEGGRGEWRLVERELERRRAHGEEAGHRDGAAVGFFRFDGSFRFGFYDRPFVHDGRGWNRDPSGSSGMEPGIHTNPPGIPFTHEISRDSYLSMVKRAKEYIASGDIYQVCLAHRFSAPHGGDPWPFYLALRSASPAPHAAYMKLGDETVLSSSPECFLKMEGRSVMTRPIKGTRPRGSTPEEDARMETELLSSAKESAELLMITDLERNDLGQVCVFGSVAVSRLLELERHPQVFHLVSTVEGTLRPGISHVAALAACFPGGSISGAPKKRALQVIRELEPSDRGLFTGAIGYFGYSGRSQFNIAIRTVTIRDGRAEFHVGAGITSDSDPELEWEETLHKAAGILRAAGIEP